MHTYSFVFNNKTILYTQKGEIPWIQMELDFSGNLHIYIHTAS